MSTFPSEIEPSMCTVVLQSQTALGGIMQRGLGIQIDSVECLEPNSWNKLEIPERLNGEGVAIAIMARQGGYLLFISDNGILLPSGFGATLDDPTQPLPIMANQLQRAIQPDVPEYVGKRIGKAKVFSSMARRAGVDNSSQILPIKLCFGGQESLIWFVGSVPHPDRAFAKRNPNSELRKKSKLFSDEILTNFTVSSDIVNSSSDSSQPTEETTDFLDESSSEINNKTGRSKADLGRLLALKSAAVEDNGEWQSANFKESEKPEENSEEQNEPFPIPTPSVEELSYSDSIHFQQDEATVDQTLAETLQSSLLTPSCPIDVEKDVVIVQGDAISECILHEEVDSENADAEDDAQEDKKPEEETVSDETIELISEDDNKRYAFHSAHIDYPIVHSAPPIPFHPTLKMPVSLDAVISHRRCLVQDILSWKPGCVIEFDNIQPTITLESNGVVLGRGKPIEQNMRIGIQLE